MNSKIVIEAMLIDENGNEFKISKKYTVKNSIQYLPSLRHRH
jgi:hypothetical protein